MTLSKPYLPNSEQVGVAWLKRYPFAGTSVGVATSLPKTEALPDDGFVTVRLTNAGQPSVDLPKRTPLLAIDCWAAPLAKGGSPRWNQAAQLSEMIRVATEDRTQAFDKTLDLGADFKTPVVFAVWLSLEPRRFPDDPSGYARFTFDLNAHWGIR